MTQDLLFLEYVSGLVKSALAEDIGSGDISAQLVDPAALSFAQIKTRESMLVCGCAWVNEVFRQIDPTVSLLWQVKEGERIVADTVLCELRGKSRSLLTGERTALNFLQFLAGIATHTRQFVDVLSGVTVKLRDTRKTIPNLRLAQKYAVTVGGGHNHRMGLFDAFLIKENHIAACGSIKNAIHRARQIHPDKKLEVEVENLNELKEALASQPDIIMLDNFEVEQIHKAVSLNQGRVKLEVSGGINLNNIREVALTGVDYISIGSLTKDIKAIDLSMRIFA